MMQQLIVVVAALLLGSMAADAQEDCRAIQDATARLACFDRAAADSSKPPAKAPTPKEPTTKVEKKNVDAQSGWELRKTRDKMTDKTSCIVSPIGRPEIQITQSDLYISYARRGGVQGFRYRIDDNPASEMQLPTDIERQIGAVHITGQPFQRILSGRRLVVSTLTLVAGLKEEDISLIGLRKPYERMQRECDE